MTTIPKRKHFSLHRVLLVLSLIFISTSVFSQSYLTVRNQNRPKRFRFDFGDYIGVKLKDDRKVYQGELQGFTDSTIYIAGTMASHVIRIDEIRIVKDYRWQNFTGALARSALYTIPFFLIGEAATGSGSVKNFNDLTYRPGYILSVVYAGLAAILYPVKGRRFKIGNRWKLLVISPYGG